MNINKEELKKKAIMGTKSLIVGGVIKAVSDRDNRKRLYKYVLDKTSLCIKETSSNNYLYYRLCLWIYRLNNKHFNNNINIHDNNQDGGNTSVNVGTYMILYKNSLLIIECEQNGVKFGEEMISTGEKIKINIIGKNSKSIYEEITNSLLENDWKNMLRLSNLNFNERFVPKRYINTIYSDQIDEIVNIINKWKSNKDIYKKNGISFKTGLLLHGKTGTGKTSIAKVIASEFNMKIQYINLASCEIRELQRIYLSDDCVILLEEIDLINTETKEIDKSNEKYREKLSVLLNVLDGIDSPNNNIIIATTNKLEDIDERLLRKGRFDNVIEITDICKETAIRMCNGFGVNPDKVLDNYNTYNPSELQDKIFKAL